MTKISNSLNLFWNKLFYFIRFPRPCLQYRKGRIENKELKKHFKECNDCLKYENWVKSCGRSDDKFNCIDKVSWRHYILCSLHFMGKSGPTDEFPDPIKFSAKVSKPMVRKLFTQQILFIVYYIIKFQSFIFFDFLKLEFISM